MFLEAIFFAFEKTFPSKIFVIALYDIIGLQNFHCLSANHKTELGRVICTSVSLFAPVLHFLLWCHT